MGPLANSGIALTILPVVTARWATWRRLHPDTKVLAQETGYKRDYNLGAAYGAYFASTKLMFPVAVADPAHQRQLAFGVRAQGSVKAWPLERFVGSAVINDRVGFLDVVLIGDASERTVRAYEADGHSFAPTSDPARLSASDGGRTVTEAAILGPHGESLRRLRGHFGYRFAWDGHFGAGVEA